MVLSQLLSTAAIAICAGTASAAVELPVDHEIGEHLLEPVMDTIVPERPAHERRRIEPGELGEALVLTPEQKQEFVDQHNEWRNRAALGELNGNKKAKQMPKLYWDEEIAEHARRYSHRCQWEHSRPAGWGELDYSVGENLYAGWGHPDHISKAMDGWAGEHVGYDHDTRACSIDMCGHYTAVVWEQTTRLGCAMTLCDNVSRLSSGKRIYVICQYYRAGNFPRKPYEYASTTGGGCADSPYGASTGMDLQYPGLCNNQNEICEHDNRCRATQDCVASTPLNGFDSAYTCGAPKCHYDEIAGWQIKNSFPSVNGMRSEGGSWVFLQTRNDCEDWCFLNKGSNPPCQGCTQSHNQHSALWFPVKTVEESQREQRSHSDGSTMVLAILDCSEPGADPTFRPTFAPPPTPKPTKSPTLPGSFECSSTTTVTGMQITMPFPDVNGLPDEQEGSWKFCHRDQAACIEWCRERRFTGPCMGVTTGSRNPNFYFPVKTVAEDQRMAAPGGSIVILECTSEPGTGPNPTDPPTSPPTNPPTDPPTSPPTNPPTVPTTSPPTNPPTDPPTSPPTNPPTNPPTEAATEPPTDAPTDPPTGDAFGCSAQTGRRECKRLRACRWARVAGSRARSCIPFTCATAKRKKNCVAVNCTWDRVTKCTA